MNNKVRLLGAIALLGLSATGLTSCGSKTDLSIWCNSGDKDFMGNLITQFKAANADYKGKVIKVIATMAENETGGNVTKDLGAAADVMLMADDNIRTAVNAACLEPLTADEVTSFTASDGLAAVTASKIGDKYYGRPYRCDNSYLLVYNSAIVSDTQSAKLEDILAACKAKSAKCYFPISNSWYTPSFLWAAGGKQNVIKDSKGKDVINSNFYSDDIASAAQSVSDLFAQYKGTWVSGDDTAAIESGFADTTVGACILWNDLANIQAKCPTAKVTTLPSINMNGADKPLFAFRGYKHVVVKAGLEGDTLTMSQKFADFVASKDAQQQFLDTQKYGVSNLSIKATPAYQSIDWVKMISVEEVAGRLVEQAANVTGSFWDPVAAFGTLITTSAPKWGTYENAKAALKSLVTSSGWNGTTYVPVA
jgi:maltose-binding protein MalE